MTYLHYILTRFNVGLYNDKYWKTDKNGNRIEPESWLEERFDIFDKFCAPSIMNQTCKNFIWLVWYDIRTPEKWKAKIDSYKDIHNYRACFARTVSRRELYSPCITESRAGKNSHLVTTRFDNDDSLHRDTVEDIQKNVENTDLMFLNLQQGYTYDLKEKKFYATKCKANAFITAVEALSQAKTILGWGNHAQLKITHPTFTKELSDKRYWIQVIHDHNLMNKIKGIITTANYLNYGMEQCSL
jgi:hypothetical protein